MRGIVSASLRSTSKRAAIILARSLASRCILSTTKLSTSSQTRSFSSSLTPEEESVLNQPREAMNYDVVIVGAGPSGLSAAIRLKQLAKQHNRELSVCIVEKGAEVGAHILSGNVFDPRALNELIPDWKEKGAPLNQPVTSDKFFFLTEKSSIPLPITSFMNNHGNYIISLADLTRWLAKQAEEEGVEIFPGFAASEVLFEEVEDEKGVKSKRVVGIATNDQGVDKQGKPKDTFTRGIEIRGHQTILAEGTRGSLSETVIESYQLRKNACPQTYGLGLKEVWEVENVDAHPYFKAGETIHTIGWPASTLGKGLLWGEAEQGSAPVWLGSFLYMHQDEADKAANKGKIFIGLVVGLDYQNPFISPYMEFQRFKHHPEIAKYLTSTDKYSASPISYGARCINEGGWQSIPELSFDGGMLVGCSAGFLNVARIKGSHTAIKSGSLAAESIFQKWLDSKQETFEEMKGKKISEYDANLKNSWINKELYTVRNIHPSHHFGQLFFLIYSALEAYILKGKGWWTFKHKKEDWEKTAPINDPNNKQPQINYPKPDGVLSFDLLTNLQRSGTNHDHDQPSHLRVKTSKETKNKPIATHTSTAAWPVESYLKYGAPETRFCPAKVYEFTVEEQEVEEQTTVLTADGKQEKRTVKVKREQPKLVINAQNCVHCKTCDIKAPNNYIKWTVPEGAGGPQYGSM